MFATQITKVVPEAALELFLQEMTATGGIMIIAIGLNLLGLTKIRVANLLAEFSYCRLLLLLLFITFKL